MSFIEDSFLLLSSMSPKVDKSKKVSHKKATTLALKKQVRRSSIYNSKCCTTSSFACITSSSSEEVSSDNGTGRKTNTEESVIVVESSSDAESVISDSDKDSYKTAGSEVSRNDDEKINSDHINIQDKQPTNDNNDILKKYRNLCFLNTNNFVETEKKSNKNIDDILNKYLNDDERKTESGSASPFLKKWIEDLDTNFDNVEDNNSLGDVSILPRFNELLAKSSSTDNNENLGDTSPLRFDKLLARINNKRRNGQATIENGDLDDSLRNNLNNLSIQEDIVVSDSLSDSEGDECPSTPKIFDDQEKLLDELYGPTWRESQEKILPKTEKKKPTNRHLPVPSKDKCRTEIKPRVSITYKNPYLDSEKKKSSLLRQLQIARTRINVESPWNQQLNNLCDSDSESTDQENKNHHEIRKKLNFNECEEDDINKITPLVDHDQNQRRNKTVHKKKQKPMFKYSLSDSSFSDEELDHKEIKTKTKQIVQKPILQKSAKIHSFLESLSRSIPVIKCDPAARIYRENFKVHKEELTQKLYTMFNENIFEQKLPDTLVLEWNNRMRGTAGFCYCRKITRRTGVVERNARIALSVKVVDSADRLRDTLVHEMCHAAAWIINEVSDGHGPFWKAWAAKAMKVYPELPQIKRCHDYAINTKYTYKCTGCGYSIGRHSKSLDVERKRCGYCYGKFEVLINKVGKDGVKSVPVTPRAKASVFADFVKENYKTVKTSSLKHGDVMKILSKQFNEMKINKNKE